MDRTAYISEDKIILISGVVTVTVMVLETGSRCGEHLISFMFTGNVQSYQDNTYIVLHISILLSAYCDDRDKPLVRVIAATKTKKSDKVRVVLENILFLFPFLSSPVNSQQI